MMAALPARRRERTEIQRFAGGYALKNSRRLVNFSDNDYLGLSFHPKLVEAVRKAVQQYGAGAGASRLVTGNHPLYAELEKALAAFKGAEDALVFGSGFLMNLGVVNGLINKDDIILADKLIHASLVDAIKLSGVKFQRFHHNDMAHLEALLQKISETSTTTQVVAQKIYILTEGVFSMDGDTAPLSEMLVLAEKYNAAVIMDDAHGFGVLGQGRGSAAAQNVALHPNLIKTGTFSKACGSYGGYICATKNQIEHLVNNARSLIYTTGLPPAVIAANIAALEMLESEPELAEKVMSHAAFFCELLNLPAPQSAIIPVIIGGDAEALAASQELEDAGFLVSAIRPPTVPRGTSRLRITMSAVHSRSDIEKLAILVRKWVS